MISFSSNEKHVSNAILYISNALLINGMKNHRSNYSIYIFHQFLFLSFFFCKTHTKKAYAHMHMPSFFLVHCTSIIKRMTSRVVGTVTKCFFFFFERREEKMQMKGTRTNAHGKCMHVCLHLHATINHV